MSNLKHVALEIALCPLLKNILLGSFLGITRKHYRRASVHRFDHNAHIIGIFIILCGRQHGVYERAQAEGISAVLTILALADYREFESVAFDFLLDSIKQALIRFGCRLKIGHKHVLDVIILDDIVCVADMVGIGMGEDNVFKACYILRLEIIIKLFL